MLGRRLQTDGFLLPKDIVFGLSAQLGGSSSDPQYLVDTFKQHDGEVVSDFHMRVLEVNSVIELQKDQTGQSNRLIGKYIEILYNVNTMFQITLHRYYQEWIEFRRYHSDISNKSLKFYLEEIYGVIQNHQLSSTMLTSRNNEHRSPTNESIMSGVPQPTVNAVNNNTEVQTTYPGRDRNTKYQRFPQGNNKQYTRLSKVDAMHVAILMWIY